MQDSLVPSLGDLGQKELLEVAEVLFLAQASLEDGIVLEVLHKRRHHNHGIAHVAGIAVVLRPQYAGLGPQRPQSYVVVRYVVVQIDLIWILMVKWRDDMNQQAPKYIETFLRTPI